MYTINQLRNYATILKSGKETFWASDFGFSGGDINGLSYDFIEPTGNTREELVAVGGELFKKVQIKEWRLRRYDNLVWEKIVHAEIKKAINLLYSTADLLRELGH